MDVGNVGSVLGDTGRVSVNVSLDGVNLLSDGLLVLLFSSTLSGLGTVESLVEVSNLGGAGSESLLLGVEILGQLDLLFLVLNLLLGVLGLLSLVLVLLLLVHVLLLDNISGFNTLRDVSDGLFLSRSSVILGSLDLGLDLGDLSLRFLNLLSDGGLLGSGGLDGGLDGVDLSGDRGKLSLVALDLGAISGGGNLGVEFLLSGSDVGESVLVIGDLLLNFLDDLLLAGDLLSDLLLLGDGDLFDLGSLLSQFGGSLLNLNDLDRDVRSTGGGSGSS